MKVAAAEGSAIYLVSLMLSTLCILSHDADNSYGSGAYGNNNNSNGNCSHGSDDKRRERW